MISDPFLKLFFLRSCRSVLLEDTNNEDFTLNCVLYYNNHDVLLCVMIGHNFNVFTGNIAVFYRTVYDYRLHRIIYQFTIIIINTRCNASLYPR